MSMAASLLLTAALFGADTEKSPAPAPLHVESVLLTLVEQVDVPSREAGVLSSLNVTEGQLVTEQDILGQIDDTEAQIARNKARIERDIAVKEAQNDVKIRFSNKSLEVARAELRRAVESIEKYKKSISETEIDRLRLAAERAVLEVEQNERERETAQLMAELKQAEHELAVRIVERRKIFAPTAGVIVEINQHRGEWVEPGETVLRMLRIDRLRAEGFVKSKDLEGDLVGRPVTLTVDLPGKPNSTFTGALVFVSPEVNPVNSQVRVWAEIENPELLLRPGLRASMVIAPKGNPPVKPQVKLPSPTDTPPASPSASVPAAKAPSAAVKASGAIPR